MLLCSPIPSYVKKNWVKMASKQVFIGGGVENAPPLQELIAQKPYRSRVKLNIQNKPMKKWIFCSLNQNRNLETDFWIFLVASYFLKVLQLKNFFKDTSKLNQNKSLSKEEIVTGTYLIRGLRVRIFFYRDQKQLHFHTTASLLQ